MKVRYALALFTFLLFTLQYSLVFQDVRFEVYQQLTNQSWKPQTYGNWSYGTQVYLQSYTYFVWIPTMKLYLQGPAVGVVGFWQGKSQRDICSVITAIDAEFWNDNVDKCNQTIFRKLESFITLSHLVMVALLTLSFGYWLFTNWFYSRLIDQVTDNLIHKVLNHKLFSDIFAPKKVT